MTCILFLTRCTYYKKLEMIQPLVQELYYSTFCIFGFGPLVAKPRIRSDRSLACTQSFHLGVHVYKVSGQ
jgi:hypothetical protein